MVTRNHAITKGEKERERERELKHRIACTPLCATQHQKTVWKCVCGLKNVRGGFFANNVTCGGKDHIFFS